MSPGRCLAAAGLVVSGLLVSLATGHASNPIADQVVANAPQNAFETFLERLRSAESGGRLDAKNPRSTALGPFQFIKSTFLDIARRHFPDEIAGLSEKQILGLRTNPDLSRRAAAVFC